MHMHTCIYISPQLVHARLCNGAAASLPWKLLRNYLKSCANVHLHLATEATRNRNAFSPFFARVFSSQNNSRTSFSPKKLITPTIFRWKWCSQNNFAIFSTARGQTATWQCCWGVGGFSATAQTWLRVQTHRKVRHGKTHVWVTSSHGLLFGGSDIGFVCTKFFVSVFFLRPMMCLKIEVRFLIRKRATCWLCYVWIENSYNTCVKSNPSWVVKISTEH